MIQFYKQRDFGDKINVTFQYITENIRSLGLSLLYIVGPVALAAGIASGIFQSNIFKLAGITRGKDYSGVATNPFQIFQTVFSPAFGLTILFSLLAVLAVSLATYAHMKVYVRKTTGNALVKQAEPVDISVEEVWKELKPMIGRGIIVSVLSSIVVSVAFLFLVIPGIYVSIVLSLGLVITSFEQTNFGGTWNRCFTLIRDKWWSTLGLIVVMGIISWVISLVFSIPAGILNFLVASKLLPDLTGFWLILSNVISTVGSTLLRSMIYIALGFQYANLVERQEGRGLLSAIDSIGAPSTQPRATDEDVY